MPTKNNYQNINQDTRLDKIEAQISCLRGEISDIKENHLSHINTSLAKIQTDLIWIKKFFWLVAGSAIAAIVASIVNLMK
jgi:hypothetical protein